MKGLVSNHTVESDGSVVGKEPNDAVPVDVLKTILEWKREGVDMNDNIDRLQVQTVPAGCPIHPWIPG